MDQAETSRATFQTQKPPVFNGEGYQIWSVRMKAFLEGTDLWEPVEEDYEIPPLGANPTVTQMRNHKERVTKKAKAKSCIFSAVTPSVLIKIMKLGSAKLMWDFLKSEYEGNEKIRSMKVLNLLRDFERQQMKEEESVTDYADRLVTIINNVRILGTDVADEKIVQKLLVSVPERFEATIATLENTKEISAMKLPEILGALQAQEQRRLMRKEESVEGALMAKAKGKKAEKTKKKKQKSDAEGKKQTSAMSVANASHSSTEPCKHCNKTNHPHWRCWRNPNVKCRACKKLGHIERFCRNKGHQIAEAKPVEMIDTENLFVATCYASGADKSG
ncbi:PREDICTED: uncharacterized protein LOC104806972 [Tarenaya hassleriana]|uniref:uncharacterized protein LOC104806972 n=1 Tax=Tarenaya hassleriana TaxID=28532 RepID=UPI00053C3B57|nr:PREDICTED: uncharacterized protein LOC104806972 [Tarenaya hassleriana]